MRYRTRKDGLSSAPDRIKRFPTCWMVPQRQRAIFLSSFSISWIRSRCIFSCLSLSWAAFRLVVDELKPRNNDLSSFRENPLFCPKRISVKRSKTSVPYTRCPFKR